MKNMEMTMLSQSRAGLIPATAFSRAKANFWPGGISAWALTVVGIVLVSNGAQS
jgi:hypothetical protein